MGCEESGFLGQFEVLFLNCDSFGFGKNSSGFGNGCGMMFLSSAALGRSASRFIGLRFGKRTFAIVYGKIRSTGSGRHNISTVNLWKKSQNRKQREANGHSNFRNSAIIGDQQRLGRKARAKRNCCTYISTQGVLLNFRRFLCVIA